MTKLQTPIVLRVVLREKRSGALEPKNETRNTQHVPDDSRGRLLHPPVERILVIGISLELGCWSLVLLFRSVV